MALVDELRGYAKALGNEAARAEDYPLAACAETMRKAANEIERLHRESAMWDPD